MASKNNWSKEVLFQSSTLAMMEGGLIIAGFYRPLSGDPFCFILWQLLTLRQLLHFFLGQRRQR